MAKKTAKADYKLQTAVVLSSRYVDSVNSNVHTLELPDGTLTKAWSDDNLVPIGTKVAVDVRSTDGKAFFA
jgi:hypothetical protein